VGLRLTLFISVPLIAVLQEVVEPLEDTRSELIFATEPLLSSLYLATPGSPYSSKLVDLDEVEVRWMCFTVRAH